MGVQRFFLVILILFFCNYFPYNVHSQKKELTVKNKNNLQEILKEVVPLNQQNFMNNLGIFATQYKTSTNAIQKYLLREKRKKFLNNQLKERLMNEWVGRILKLETTNNGEAILEIELAKILKENAIESPIDSNLVVKVETLKNTQADLDYKTLIPPETPLHTWLANFNEGEWVVFSGNSFEGEKDYLKELGHNENDAMLAPRFLLKFKFFEKINFPENDSTLNKNSSTIEATGKNERHQSIELRTSNTITIRYYKFYRLSNYDWDYKNYIDRLNQLVRYNWNNHPPSDYFDGTNPKGGEIFVTATIKRDGNLKKLQVNSLGEISKNMLNSAIESVRTVSHPPLPEDFPDQELIVEFRFEHNRMSHLINKSFKQTKTEMLPQNNNSNNRDSLLSKMEKKLIQKQLLAEVRSSFHEELKQEFSSHFHPNQRFDPNLELLIDLGIDHYGKVIEKKLILPSNSVKFRLSVMNGISKANIDSLPKSLKSQAPYRVRLRVIP